MSLSLRRIKRREWLLAQTAAECHRNGWDANLEYPSRYGMWVSLSDSKKKWKAWLRLSDWLEHVSPELAGVATSANLEHLVVPWLAAIECPFTLPLPNLAFRRLCVGNTVAGKDLPHGPLLRIMSDRGGVWFEILPEFTIAGGGKPNTIPWSLRFVLGTSEMPQLLLRRVCSGDVLLIRTQCQAVFCETKKIGQFSHVAGGIIVESLDIQEIQSESSNSSETLQSFDNLPVKLEFILHRKQVTLSELEKIGLHQLLPLSSNIERNIEIMANGVLLGTGELVQLDETLGVEIHEWMSEKSNGE